MLEPCPSSEFQVLRKDSKELSYLKGNMNLLAKDSPIIQS